MTRSIWSIPSRRSTTTASWRRSSPQTFSTSSASCTPSTSIRLPRATRARAGPALSDPEAVRVGPAGPPRTGANETARPSTANDPGTSAKARSVPAVARRWTAPASKRMTVPRKPEARCTTGVPGDASTSG